MEPKRFRNHFSSVIEQMWGLIFCVCVILVNHWSDEGKSVSGETEITDFFQGNFWIVVSVLLLMGIILAYNIIIWLKTYISIDDETITIERQTVNRRIDTIGIRNIANVNIEQNLFERIIGTCKVKLDTNTLSTANETDVAIILKKDIAEQFKAKIMKCLQAQTTDIVNQAEEIESEGKATQHSHKRSYQYEATKKDIIWNSICQISFLTLCVLISTLGVGILNLMEVIEMLQTAQGYEGMGIKLVVSVAFIGSGIWALIKSFFDYGDFKVAREQDKIYLKYGLLKKVEYTLPIEKMNGLVIKQTLIARLIGRYIIEVINIGSGDETGELGNRLALACTKEEMTRLLGNLLPEYPLPQIEKIQKQPRKAIILQGIKYIMGICIVVLVIELGIKILDKDLEQIHKWLQISIVIAMVGLAFLRILLGYYTKGTYVGEGHMTIATGMLRREITILRYDKIQYVTIKENSLSSVWKVAKGNVYLLAGLLNQNKAIPYCAVAELEQIVCKVVKK